MYTKSKKFESSKSRNIDWDADKNHILKGSGNGHVNGWKKFGIDPNGSNGWKGLLPILKIVVDKYDSVSKKILPDGSKIFYYTKSFGDIGESVVVKIWQSSNGAINKLSDAWPVK